MASDVIAPPVAAEGIDSRRISTGSEKSNASTKEKSKAEKICVVCGDTATGTHFAAMTCEGCKGFFRRSMKKEVQFSCAFDNKCVISRTNRKHCQSCRLNKCLAVGMDASLIMSDESVNRKRELIRQNREKRALQRAKKEQQELESQMRKSKISKEVTGIRMTMEDKHLIETLLKGHHSSYDFSYEEYETFRGREIIPTPADVDKDPSDMTLAWLMASVKPEQAQAMQEAQAAKQGRMNMKQEAQGEDLGFPVTSPQDNSMIPREVLDIFSSLHGIPEASPAPQTSVDEINNDLINSVDGILSQDTYDVDSYSFLPEKPQDGAMCSSELPQLNPEAMHACGSEGAISMSQMHSGSEGTSFLQTLLQKQGIPLSLMKDEKTRHLLQHFCDIMTWGIKKVIEFCKFIPEFQELSTVDQINLLRGGCLEMLVLRSYFAFAAEGNKYMSDKFQYTPTDFMQAGASQDFVEMYGSFHLKMRKMKLKVEEICMLIALVLFSPDRPGLEASTKIGLMQDRVANALRAYEFTHKPQSEALNAYTEILLLLPVLRTINVLFSNTILTLKGTNGEDINPLILEVNPKTSTV